MGSTDFSGKVVAITGAAQGIGLATAKVLYARGASLALADINGDILAKAVSSITGSSLKTNQKITTNTVDVRKSTLVDAWIETIVLEHGKLDGAANIAGVLNPVPNTIINTTDDDWDFVMDVNARGVFNCIRAELREMLPAKSGAIVNVASVLGVSGMAGMSPYCSSKHLVVGLTRTAAKEAGPEGVRVNAVAPGVIDTQMMADFKDNKVALEGLKARTPLGRIAQAEEVGKAIAFLLSEDASFQTGAIVAVDGGWMS